VSDLRDAMTEREEQIQDAISRGVSIEELDREDDHWLDDHGPPGPGHG
jgi:hypothetical protein